MCMINLIYIVTSAFLFLEQTFAWILFNAVFLSWQIIEYITAWAWLALNAAKLVSYIIYILWAVCMKQEETSYGWAVPLSVISP